MIGDIYLLVLENGTFLRLEYMKNGFVSKKKKKKKKTLWWLSFETTPTHRLADSPGTVTIPSAENKIDLWYGLYLLTLCFWGFLFVLIPIIFLFVFIFFEIRIERKLFEGGENKRENKTGIGRLLVCLFKAQLHPHPHLHKHTHTHTKAHRNVITVFFFLW